MAERRKSEKLPPAQWVRPARPSAAARTHPLAKTQGTPKGIRWHGGWMAELVHQVAPAAKIIPVRARLDEAYRRGRDGRYPYEKYLIQGIRFAADQGAVAVTNSMGPVTQSEELREAIDYAEQKGTIFINVHPETKTNPDTVDKRIIHTGLVAVSQHKTRSESGRDIYVWPYEMNPVYQDGWGFSNGPPSVAGALTLMRGANPKLTPAQIRSILGETAENRDGFAVLNAEAAVKRAVDLRD
jgi:hypothetical protein